MYINIIYNILHNNDEKNIILQKILQKYKDTEDINKYYIFCNLKKKEIKYYYPNLDNKYIKEIVNRLWLIEKN